MCTVAGETPRDIVGDDFCADSFLTRFCEARLLRVEASLVLLWWPNILHSLFSDHLKTTISTYRVGCWYLARRVEGGGVVGRAAPLQAKRSLPWLMVSWAMPHIGLGWMAPRWLPDAPMEGVEEDAASDSSASAK
jgi:hypothetical protein